MAKPIYVPVVPSVLHWAIQESEQDILFLESKFKYLSLWLTGERQPTYQQLTELSTKLSIPIGYFFLPNPPSLKENISSEFRTIKNIKATFSKNLRDTLYNMEFKKNWMSEFRYDNGWEKLPFIGIFDIDSPPTTNTVREAFFKYTKLDHDWYTSIKKFEDAVKLLRSNMEDAGVIVMQNSVVGENNYRKLDIDEFRAFVLTDEYAPLIFLNRRDSFSGMIFSMVHEFLHLFFDSGDIVTNIDTTSSNTEQLLNQLTADILMPSPYLLKVSDWNYDKIERIAQILKVSKLALAIQLYSKQLINNKLLKEVQNKTATDLQYKKIKKHVQGNYYSTKNSRLGHMFNIAVISQAESGNLRYTDAYKLLDICNGHTYHEYKNRIMV